MVVLTLPFSHFKLPYPLQQQVVLQRERYLFAISVLLSSMAPRTSASTKKATNKGAWTAEEDRQLAQYVNSRGANGWKTIAAESGLNRCGKSCRLRWLNYLRPNIKRGNISDEEEDLILRLHKLLGNRWSLIAGRLPGRTDNEIKNYWNSHLSKKAKSKEEGVGSSIVSEAETAAQSTTSDSPQGGSETASINGNMGTDFDADDFFDFSSEGSHGLDWINKFLEMDGNP